jgi:hypothetical protein
VLRREEPHWHLLCCRMEEITHIMALACIKMAIRLGYIDLCWDV